MLEKTKDWIAKALSHLETEFSKLQAWRANPAMIEDIRIESYWSLQPIKNVANISVMDSQTLSIMPWDRSQIHAIAKAITESWIGLNPQTMADSVLIRVPAVTEERRKDLIKLVAKTGEQAKVAIRNERREANEAIKKMEKTSELTEDDSKKAQDEVQKLTDSHIKMIDDMLAKKEKDIMEV